MNKKIIKYIYIYICVDMYIRIDVFLFIYIHLYSCIWKKNTCVESFQTVTTLAPVPQACQDKHTREGCPLGMRYFQNQPERARQDMLCAGTSL